MNVPRLRFKKFTHEWEEIELSSLLEFKNGINADGEKYGRGIKFINVLDILNNSFITYDKIIGLVDVDEKTIDNYAVSYGDIVFQRSSETNEEVGTANVYLDDKKAVFGGFIIRGKKMGEYNPMFMNHMLKSPLARVEIMKKSGGSTRYNLSQATLSSVKVFTTTIEEQDKVAKFLSTIDTRVEIQYDKIKNLEEMKAGLMQKIFSQEIRFKREDGSEYPEWERETLSKVVEKKFKGAHPIYSKAGNILLNNDCLDNNASPIFVDNIPDVEKNDILILWDGSQAGRAYTGFTGVLGSTLVGLRLIRDKANNAFIQQFLEFNLEVIQQTWRTGSGVPHVTKEFVERFMVPVPILTEQNKIAAFLSTIDEKIELEKDIFDVLKDMKKGLLQQMFV